MMQQSLLPALTATTSAIWLLSDSISSCTLLERSFTTWNSPGTK